MEHEKDPRSLSPGDVLEGRWHIEGVLGRGGFATVYRATHVKLGRPAAVKVLDIQAPPGESSSFHERFLREAKLSAQIEHPNVVQILDYGVLDEGSALARPFIVMEMLRGHDLEHELVENGPIAPERAWSLFAGALEALEESHDMGIVHKDLKPSNLFVSRPGSSNERLVVVDFGIARAWDDPGSKLTATSQFTGTPAYLAPEYIESQHVTPAIDVYQMGLILAESLSGEPVVQASTPLAYLMAHCNGLQRIPAHLDGTPLGDVLARAVSVEPGDRHASAAELRSALAAIDWSSVPRHDDPATPRVSGSTNPLPPPDMRLVATPSVSPTEPNVPTGANRGALALGAALVLLVAGAVAAFILFSGPDDDATPVAVAEQEATGAPTPATTAEKADTPSPEVEVPAAATPDAGAPEVAAATPDAGAPTGDGSSASDAPAVVSGAAGTSSSAKPKKKKKVVIKENYALLARTPEDDVLESGYQAFRYLAWDVEMSYHAYADAFAKHGPDDPAASASSFSDVSRHYVSGVRALEKVSRSASDRRLKAAARALARATLSINALCKEGYENYRMKRGYELFPEKAAEYDAKWKRLIPPFVRAKNEYIDALFAFEQATLKSRLSKAKASTSPMMHHYHAALYHASRAVDAGESGYQRELKKAKSHIDAFKKIDVHAHKDVLSSSQRNTMVTVIKRINGAIGKLPKIASTKKKNASAGILKGIALTRKNFIPWRDLYMAWGAGTREYYRRKN